MLTIITLIQALFLVVLAFKENTNRLYVMAFGLGLLTDFFLGTTWGFSSIFDLAFVFLIALFKRKFAYDWRWAIVFVVLFQFISFYAWKFNI